MVLQNRLDYGFNGYQVPPVPQATRSSTRRRGNFRNRVDDKQTCAFDMLASVAGNFLLGRIPSSFSDCDTSTVKDDCKNVKVEKSVENTQLKVEPGCPDNGGRDFLVSEPVNDQDCSLPAGFASEPLVSTNTSNRLIDGNLEEGQTNGMGNFVNEVGGGSRIIKDEFEKVANDRRVFDLKSQTLLGSENGVEEPPRKDHCPRRVFPASQVDATVVGKDDGNSFGCTHPTASMNSFRKAPCIGGQRIRKILASKNWKVAATYGTEKPKIGRCTRKFYFNRRNSYKSQRSQTNIPFKKRKLFDRFFSNCSGERITERSSDLTKKGTKRKSSVHRKTSLIARQQGDSHVKLRIKSFRVPELFIEIPESATVSSLKRTVMEAVTAIIGHGIHVGVLIQGKKIRDDNKTLFQTGISCDNQDGFLGFSLEPHSSQISSSLCHGHGGSPSTSPCTSSPEPITRCTPNPAVDYPGSNRTWLLETDADLSNSVVSNHVCKSSTNSKALVPVPAMSVKALAVVPVCKKPKRLEVGPRRTRRPFSVAEVEALVHAVETLGTGRWRDVKLRAFNDANHRTYVDLKDKWKTLVHTARIAPQQRRGEPVPQEVLERVLTAQAYWSQQQQPHTCLLLP